MRALITAINIAYEEENRVFVEFYAVAFLFTVALIGAAVLALIFLVAVPLAPNSCPWAAWPTA